MSSSEDAVEGAGGREDEKEEVSKKPSHIPKEKWERFQKLKARREKCAALSSKSRKRALKRSAIKAARRNVTVKDVQDILNYDEGMDITLVKSSEEEGQSSSTGSSSKSADPKWEDIRPYMNPNPHLTQLDRGRYAEKSGLEKTLDAKVDQGQYEEAVAISEELSRRELACKVSKAFDCYKYVQDMKEKKVKKKPALQWNYVLKKRWETKSNM